MKKLAVLASAAAMAFSLAGPNALAQSFGYSEIVMSDHSMRTSKLIGLPIVNEQGQKIGTIVDVLVKDKGTEPLVILSVGEFAGDGAKMVAAPLSHITVEKTQITMAGATKQMMANMPAYSFNPLNGGGG